jgi:hypothetical protein
VQFCLIQLHWQLRDHPTVTGRHGAPCKLRFPDQQWLGRVWWQLLGIVCCLRHQRSCTASCEHPLPDESSYVGMQANDLEQMAAEFASSHASHSLASPATSQGRLEQAGENADDAPITAAEVNLPCVRVTGSNPGALSCTPEEECGSMVSESLDGEDVCAQDTPMQECVPSGEQDDLPCTPPEREVCCTRPSPHMCFVCARILHLVFTGPTHK